MRETALNIVKKLQENGYQAVFCGGCVRDTLLGLEPKDYDIATDALPEQVEDIFRDYKTVQCGKQFLVVRVVVDGFEFEIATFRGDGEYTDGRRPNAVTPSDMEGDSKRRDFTINALFFDPVAEVYYDFVGGIKDIENKTIRFVGNSLDRIKEDYVRILRAVRFQSKFKQLGFKLHSNATNCVFSNSSLLKYVSKESLQAELNKGLLCESGPDFFLKLGDLGLWEYIVPEVQALYYCKQDPIWHPEGDVFTHTYCVLKNLEVKDNLVLTWATILHDIGKPKTFAYNEAGRITAHGHAEEGATIAEKILKDLRFSNEQARDIVSLVRHHMDFVQIQKMRVGKRRRFYARNTFNLDLMLHKADCLGSNGDLSNYEFSKKESEETPEHILHPNWFVTGKDLIDLGLSPSPFFKLILNQIKDDQLDGTLTNREDALLKVHELIRTNNIH
jgi:poly(A) polymerase